MDRFESIKNDFESLFYSLDYFIENAESANAEDVFETISHLLSDIHAVTGKKGIKNYQVKDAENYAFSVFNIMRTASDSYNQNKDKLSDLNEGLIAELNKKSEMLNSAESELEPVCKLIDEKRSLKDSLEKKLALLKNKKDEVEALEGEIAGLEKEYERLNCISVDELKEKVNRLREEKTAKENELEKIDNEGKSLDNEITDLNKITQKLTKKNDDNQKEKERLIAEEERLNKELSGFVKWKEDFNASHIESERQLIEAQNALTIIHNAWEAINKRPDLPSVLQCFDVFKEFNQKIESYEELIKWFEEMKAGIQQAIDSYTDTYKTLISAIEQ